MQIGDDFQRAVSLHRAGRLAGAETVYRQILSREPRHAEALHMLGALAHQCGRHDAAVEIIGSAIVVDPCNAASYNNLGEAHRAAGRNDLAAEAYQKALAINPQLPEAYYNLALALEDLGRIDEAIDCNGRALRCKPNYPQALNNLGLLLKGKGRLTEAEHAFRGAIALDPSCSDAMCNCANLLMTEGLAEQAIDMYRQVLAMRPAAAEIHSNLLHAWHFHPRYDAAANFAEHCRWSERHAAPLTTAAAPHDRVDTDPDRRLHIGYVSPDLCYHPVGRFLLPALLGRDRDRFIVTCYSDTSPTDAITAQFRSAADHWHDVSRLNDEQLATRVRRDAVDILVDPTGHTAHNRLLCFARRPAPVQLTCLGYPDTTGMTAIDFRLTDAIADPPGCTEQWHTERLLRIEGCAWCFWPPEDAGTTEPQSRKEVRFGSFNNIAKVTVQTVALWAKVLTAVPDSRLVIKAAGLCASSAQGRLRRDFAALGIDPERVQPRPATCTAREHLATYAGIDIALDPVPYAGTTTTCEALWMGVPVVTLTGKQHFARVGASLLTAAGLPEFIADSPGQYIKIATSLAADHDRRHQLRLNLREQLRASRLLDVTGYARQFDHALREMWRDYCRRA